MSKYHTEIGFPICFLILCLSYPYNGTSEFLEFMKHITIVMETIQVMFHKNLINCLYFEI